MNEKRIATPVETDVVKLTARVNELERQLEILKQVVSYHVRYMDNGFELLRDLKPLINPNLFPGDVLIEKELI
jgi:hypothetical protein